MTDISQDIALNYQEVMEHIAAAQKSSPQAAKQVQLVAVSKTVPVENIRHIIDAGATDLGENRVQELLEKYDHLPQQIRWHLIGHLQTNKVKYIVDKVTMIHSLDRLELAKEIEKRAANINRVIPCLLQVNIGEDDNKFGMAAEDTLDFCKAMADYPHFQVRGLMTIGPLVDREEMRPIFRTLRELRDDLAKKVANLGLNHIIMQELSMGMSNDYDIAVEEGATMVRVGSKLFGARIYR